MGNKYNAVKTELDGYAFDSKTALCGFDIAEVT